MVYPRRRLDQQGPAVAGRLFLRLIRWATRHPIDPVHGDRMLLTEFLRTRVLELAVHGLDLGAGLGRQPWMTAAAARVVEDLVLPAGNAAQLLSESGWDQIALIAKATGRLPLTAAETKLIERHGIHWLALG